MQQCFWIVQKQKLATPLLVGHGIMEMVLLNLTQIHHLRIRTLQGALTQLNLA